MTIEVPMLDVKGKSSKGVALDDAVFGVELKPHLIHETVRAESGAARAGTRGAKSRGQVAGGASKPWRQKGTGRARQGTTRAVQFAGGGVAFPPTMRSFGGKVNRKVRASAMRSALSAHAARGSIGVVDPTGFQPPSTKAAVAVLDGWGVEGSILVVCDHEDVDLAKSFRNIDRVEVTVPSELEVRNVVGARSLLFSTGALEGVVGKAS